MQNEPNTQTSPGEEYQKNLEILEMMDPGDLAKHMANEHPQTIAVFISALSHTSQAIKILKALTEKLQADISYRILHGKLVPKGVPMEIIRVVVRELEAMGTKANPPVGGFNSFVEMLQTAEGDDASTILANLEKTTLGSDSELLPKVRKKLNVTKTP